MSFRDDVIKLAHDNPGEIRDALLPVLAGKKRVSARKMDVSQSVNANNKAYKDRLDALTKGMQKVAATWGHKFTALSFYPDSQWKWLRLTAVLEVEAGISGGTESQMGDFLKANYGLDGEVRKVRQNPDAFEITEDFRLMF